MADSAPERTAEQNHFAAVGRIASNWAYFEIVIDTWAMKLTDIHANIAACFTAQVIGPSRKFDALLAMCGVLGAPDTLQSALKSLAGRACGIGEERNRMVHDPWLVDEDIAHRLQVTAKKRLIREPIKAQPGELEALADRIDALTMELDHLGFELYKATEEQRKALPRQYGL